MEQFENILFIADRQYGLTDAFIRVAVLSLSNASHLTVMDVIPDAGVPVLYIRFHRHHVH